MLFDATIISHKAGGTQSWLTPVLYLPHADHADDFDALKSGRGKVRAGGEASPVGVKICCCGRHGWRHSVATGGDPTAFIVLLRSAVHDDVNEGGNVTHINIAILVHIGSWVIGDRVHNHIDEGGNVAHIHLTITVHITNK